MESSLKEIGNLLINQENARIVLEPTEKEKGYWIGSGNAVEVDGYVYLIARYRDSGDSTTALEKGTRGRELAIFKAKAPKDEKEFQKNFSFEKIHSWTKEDVSVQGEVVLSIEGSCLIPLNDVVYVLVGSEKRVEYPKEVEEYQKKGTGIWSIDCFHAPTIAELNPKNKIRRLIQSEDPSYLHFKDPHPVHYFNWGENVIDIMFCVHSFSWSCGTTGFASFNIARDGSFALLLEQNSLKTDILKRGSTWDVAVSRITSQFSLPKCGILEPQPNLSLYFYDGAECFREHEENERGKTRKRGYCCEELGGLVYSFDHEFLNFKRLSPYLPEFISPNGTGCSRYHNTLKLSEGGILVFWQQSQTNGSQPLVANFVNKATIENLLLKK